MNRICIGSSGDRYGSSSLQASRKKKYKKYSTYETLTQCDVFVQSIGEPTINTFLHARAMYARLSVIRVTPISYRSRERREDTGSVRCCKLLVLSPEIDRRNRSHKYLYAAAFYETTKRMAFDELYEILF